MKVIRTAVGNFQSPVGRFAPKKGRHFHQPTPKFKLNYILKKSFFFHPISLSKTLSLSALHQFDSTLQNVISQ